MMTFPPDPNLLQTLSVLLEEGHVTRAARRLGITQSSMSHRLGQLRKSFDDPLLVRVGARLVPTPRAAALAQPLAAALASLASVVAPERDFDPKTATFSLGIVMPDLLAPLASTLVSDLVGSAPRIRVQLTNIGPALSDVLAEPSRRLALAPARFFADGVRQRSLGDLRFGVTGRKGHPAFRRKLTLERWLEEDHVVVRVGNETTNVISEELAKRGVVRRIGLEVPSFLAGLHVVSTSNFLMSVPLPLGSEATRSLGLCVREAPLPLPKVPFALAWHERYQNDPAHKWARDRVFYAVKSFFARRS